jgi:hypothetical protein
VAVGLPDEVARRLDQIAIALAALDQRAAERAFGRIGRDQYQGPRGTVAAPDQRLDHRIGAVAGKRSVEPLEPHGVGRDGACARDRNLVERILVQAAQELDAHVVEALDVADRGHDERRAAEANQVGLGIRQALDGLQLRLAHQPHSRRRPRSGPAVQIVAKSIRSRKPTGMPKTAPPKRKPPGSRTSGRFDLRPFGRWCLVAPLPEELQQHHEQVHEV